MIVLVCGSRTWTDEGVVRRRLAALPPDAVILHGAARGADAIAARVADGLGFDVPTPVGGKRAHGRAAGFVRRSTR